MTDNSKIVTEIFRQDFHDGNGERLVLAALDARDAEHAKATKILNAELELLKQNINWPRVNSTTVLFGKPLKYWAEADDKITRLKELIGEAVGASDELWLMVCEGRRWNRETPKPKFIEETLAKLRKELESK